MSNTFLHADNSELIFFIHPNQEGFVGVVEDSSPLWPHLVDARSLQEAVSLLKQEVVFDELLACLLAHTGQRIIIAFEISGQRF